jgi:hypothetical protein
MLRDALDANHVATETAVRSLMAQFDALRAEEQVE